MTTNLVEGYVEGFDGNCSLEDMVTDSYEITTLCPKLKNLRLSSFCDWKPTHLASILLKLTKLEHLVVECNDDNFRRLVQVCGVKALKSWKLHVTGDGLINHYGTNPEDKYQTSLMGNYTSRRRWNIGN